MTRCATTNDAGARCILGPDHTTVTPTHVYATSAYHLGKLQFAVKAYLAGDDTRYALARTLAEIETEVGA